MMGPWREIEFNCITDCDVMSISFSDGCYKSEQDLFIFIFSLCFLWTFVLKKKGGGVNSIKSVKVADPS